MRPQRSYSWMKAWCVRLLVAALVMGVGGAASAQDIDLNPVQGAAPDIKQEEPNAKTVTELETPKAEAEVQEGEEVAEGEVEPVAEDGEAAATDEDKKKAKKGKKEKKERKSRKKKKDDA